MADKQKKHTGGWAVCLLLVLLGALALLRLKPEEKGLQPSPYAPTDFYWEDGQLRCAKADTVLGIDVSSHQKSVDWQQVKQAGVEFVFVRLGYRGYSNGALNRDAYAITNITGARNAGLKVGAYFFSQAVTVEEAEAEAAFALDILRGIELDMPLVYDWEYVSPDARTAQVDRRMLTDCTLAFCRKAKQAGYTPAVYFNQSQARDLLYLEELTDYRFWLAMYDPAAEFPCRVDFWQYTDKGTLPGIEGAVDLNMMFTKNR